MVQISLMDSYLETVAGYVLDEDKLLTYKWLSKELEVHVNVAKVILWNYWEQNKSKDLVATFMLIGYLKSGGMRVEVVKDSDLADAKEKFEKIISEHIYSVQKILTSIELLAGSGEGDSRFSAIKCIENSLLSDEEIHKMRWGEASAVVNATDDKKQIPVSEKRNAPAEKKNIFDRKKNSSAEKKDAVVSAEKKVSPVVPKKEEETCMDIEQQSSETKRKAEENNPAKKVSPSEKPKAEKKGSTVKKPVQSTKTGFGNLFGKAMNQQKIQNNLSAGVKKADTENVANKSPKEKAVATKDVQVEKSENSKKKESPPDSSSKNKNDKKESENLADAPKSPGRKEKSVLPAKKQSTGKKKQKTIRGTKRERSGEDSESEKKKRKRIVVASDSSEDSPNASDEEDMFASPPDDETPQAREKSPSPPLSKREGNKRKVRKMVDNTFMDDRGYLITKKSYVYETCSEGDEPVVEEAPKKKPEPEVPEEVKTNVKKKQTTLMTFFKKA